jgi:pyruvate dehydrogenase E1 component alpha subunit
MYDPELYRERAEVERWKERDPIDAFVRAEGIDEPALAALDTDATAAVDAAVAFAEAGTPEPVDDLLRFVTTERDG